MLPCQHETKNDMATRDFVSHPWRPLPLTCCSLDNVALVNQGPPTGKLLDSFPLAPQISIKLCSWVWG